MRSYMRR